VAVSLKTSLRHYLEYAVVRAVMGLLTILPLDMASAFGGWLARMLGSCLKANRIAHRNIARALPELSEDQIRQVVRDCWDNLGRVMGEFPHLEEIIQHRIRVENPEVIDQIMQDGKPGIFVSGHLGNWEAAGGAVFQFGLSVALVYRAANNPLVNKLFQRYRTPSARGGQVAKGPEGARELLNRLKQGEHLAMLVDQKMNDGIAVPFFGRMAMTAPAAVRFALRFDCPIIPTYVQRFKGANFRLIMLEPMRIVPSANSHQDCLETMTQLNQLLEEWIRQNPGQWLWMHKRWPD